MYLWCATQEEEEEGSGEEGWAGSDAEDASDYEEGDGSGLPQYYGMSFEELQEDSELEYLSESDAPGTWAEQDKDGAVAEEVRGPLSGRIANSAPVLAGILGFQQVACSGGSLGGRVQ